MSTTNLYLSSIKRQTNWTLSNSSLPNANVATGGWVDQHDKVCADLLVNKRLEVSHLRCCMLAFELGEEVMYGGGPWLSAPLPCLVGSYADHNHYDPAVNMLCRRPGLAVGH